MSSSIQRLSRRQALKALLSIPAIAAFGTGCERHRYIRPAAELDLGPIEALLFAIVHVKERAALVFRDVDGWGVLSTRCSYHGCDLTFHETMDIPHLFCPCCKSRWDLEGSPYQNNIAKRPLPWLQPEYRQGHLFANSGVVVEPGYRFTTPLIEDSVRKMRERVKVEGFADEVKIPDILTGHGDGEVGTMFVEDDPNIIAELEMIK